MPSDLSDKQGADVEQVENANKIDNLHDATRAPAPQHYEPTTEEEKLLDRRINMKLDIFVTAILSFGFVLCGIDKTNIGFVATSSFIQDAHLSANAVGNALSLFSATYVPLQPVSAMAARHIGPKYWLSMLLIVWGSLCMAHAGIKNNATLIALRLLLGAAESGYTPVGCYLMSLVYPKYALGLRMGAFSGMYSIAGAFAGLIAYGLLQITSSHLTGWQILFLFEGGLTVLTGIVALLVLPRSLETAWFLTSVERQHAVRRIERDNIADQSIVNGSGLENDDDNDDSVGIFRDITDVLKDWKKLLIILFNITGVLPVAALTTFLPLIVQGMGYEGVKADLMSVPPFIVGTVGLIIIVWSSDRLKERSLHIAGGLGLAMIGCIVMATSKDQRLRYGFVHVCLAGAFVAGPLVAVWLAGNTPLRGPRAFVLGLNGWTNVAGIIAGQVFNAKYAPSYKTPLTITMILIAVGIVGMLAVRIMYQLTNRRRAKKMRHWSESEVAEENASQLRRGDQRYTFIYGY